MHLSKNKLLSVWLCSAAVVTLARVFNAAELGELPIQIQAAQHLLSGKGLSVYSSPGEDDLAAPAKLLTLAHYPAGFSVYAAGLFGLGLGPGTVVKLWFAVTTMLGWWGWANLAHYFFADGLRVAPTGVTDPGYNRLFLRNRAWAVAAVLIAATTPILYTMLWKGTDTFLWAAIPWVFLWITKSSNAKAEGATRFDWLAGLLCGLSFFMRYAAILLVGYAIIVILLQSASRPKELASRLTAFAIGMLPLVILQLYLSHTPNAEAIPDIITFQGGLRPFVRRLQEGLPFIPSANVAVAWWMPHQLRAMLIQTGQQVPWLICATVVGWALLPVLLARKIGWRGLETAFLDIRTVAAGFLVALPVFLLLWTGASDNRYVVEDRYYLPLIPLVVLIVYQLATPAEHHEPRFQRWVTKASVVYVVGYLGMAIVSVLRLPLPGELGNSSRVKLMALPSQRFQWPSMKVASDFVTGRAYVLSLLREQPDTVLVTNTAEWFYAEPNIDRSRIRRVKDLQATYVSGPARIVIAIHDHAPGALKTVSWSGHYDKRWTADYFENLSDVRLLRTFPEEDIRVVEALVGENQRIELKKDTARLKPL